MSTISIKGMDKAEVLAALYNHSKQQGMGFFHARGREPMTKTQAQQELDANGPYFDYLHGRVMKVDLSKDDMYVGLYDRDNGQGAAAEAIASIA